MLVLWSKRQSQVFCVYHAVVAPIHAQSIRYNVMQRVPLESNMLHVL